MDFNAHLRNTSYLDMSADLRMMYFSSAGFSIREFERLRMGPVILRDEVDYFKEIRLLDRIRATLMLSGLAEDASRFAFRNEFFREDGRLAARVSSLGGWLHLEERRTVAPPAALAEVLRSLDRTDDFRELEGRRRATRDQPGKDQPQR
jgi:acyl-CoA thioester hydrolase